MNTLIHLLEAAVIAGTPLLLGALGEILCERAGNLNLGVEGEMFMGAVAGIAAAFFYNQAGGENGFVAVAFATLFSFLFGALGALIYAFLVVTMRANQNVTGMILTIFGTGFGNFFGAFFPRMTGKTLVVSDATKKMFGNGSLFNWMVYLALLIALLMAYFLYHTRRGLSLRAIGENPQAADAAGIPVSLYKYVATMIGGGICGLGGMYISMVSQNGNWVDNCVSGYGWLAVALVIFAAWSPYRALLVSIVFGGLMILRFYVQLPIPSQFYEMAPYAVTILVLIITSMRGTREQNQPKSCGINYFREER